MKHFLKSLFGKPSKADPDACAVSAEPALEAAFRQARERRNNDLLLPAFERARLFVVARSEGPADDLADLFLMVSPGGADRQCVTVSECEDWLSTVHWPTRPTTGARLLADLPADLDITVVHAECGDVITREQRAWYEQSRRQ